LLVVGFKSVLAAGILRNLREKRRLVALNSGRTEKRWHLTTPTKKLITNTTFLDTKMCDEATENVDHQGKNSHYPGVCSTHLHSH